MPIAAPVPEPPRMAIYADFSDEDESITTPHRNSQKKALEGIYQSNFLTVKLRLAQAGRALKESSGLREGWDTYGSQAPNALARKNAWRILVNLYSAELAPTRVLPSSEGGIAFSFVSGSKRGEIETYNTGEIIAAKYSDTGSPEIWEVQDNDDALSAAIDAINVYLAA